MTAGWELDKQKVAAWIDVIRREFEVIAPVRQHGEEVFVSVFNGAQVALDYENTLSSPKEFYLPHFETMFTFTTGKGSFDIMPVPEEMRTRVLFGVRPCDVNALLILDKAFTGDQEDCYYMKRRESTVLVALTCNKPLKRCFCGTVGAGPSLTKGFDVLLTEVDDCYLVEVATDRGKALVDKALNLFREVTAKKQREKEQIVRETEKLAAKPINPMEVARKMETRSGDSKWVELAKRCLQCGGCTYICPTCSCFDVVDRGENEKGNRLRCWDCCLLPGFTRMAGGLNPRGSGEARIKQRFYHEWDYFVQRFGTLKCVGCGRCTETALCHIDWEQVFSWATGD